MRPKKTKQPEQPRKYARPSYPAPSDLIRRAPVDADKLTIMERRFVEYMSNIGDDGEKIYTQTKAAELAGYAHPEVAGCQLFKRPKVKKAIESRIAKKFKKFDITPEFVLQELAALAKSNHADFYNDNGNLMSIKELPREVTAAVNSVEVEMRVDEQGHPAAVQKIRLYDKIRALELLGKHFGLYTDKVSVDGFISQVIQQDKEERAKQSIDDLSKQLQTEREINQIVEHG